MGYYRPVYCNVLPYTLIFYKYKKADARKTRVSAFYYTAYFILESSVFIPSFIEKKSRALRPVTPKILLLSIFRSNTRSYLNIHGSFSESR